jgi:hypothetical protein
MAYTKVHSDNTNYGVTTREGSMVTILTTASSYNAYPFILTIN